VNPAFLDPASWGIFVLCLLQAVTILFLVTSRRRLRRSEQALRMREPVGVEYSLPVTGGSCRHYEARVVTCLNGFLNIVRAITDRREAEEALTRSQLDVEQLRRMTGMGELATSIAHDVTQPLCAIIANAQASLRSHPGRSQAEQELVREALEDIVKDAKRASKLIHQTRRLFVERTNAKSPVRANELIETVVGLARRSFDAANVSVRTVLAPDLPEMLADPVLLQQVLVNLAMNAIDAMRESTRREVTFRSSLDRSEELVEISVSDTGWGLHPEEAQEVFRAFHTTRPEGMGMGLAISRAIIAAQGGRLWATPDPEGGASFRFAIPTATSAPRAYVRVPVAAARRR
jgi:C4-dicarboxylate-specific signal transduction histidine kinase